MGDKPVVSSLECSVEKEKAMEVSVRYRINVSTTSKGIKSYDCTVDAEGLSQDHALNASDVLVTELEKRYGLGAQLERLKAAVAEIEKAQQEVV